MTNDEIQIRILRADSNIFKATSRKGGDVLFFEGNKALDFYEERKSQLSMRYHLVPKNGKVYNKNRIIMVQFGDNLKYVPKEKSETEILEIPEIDIIITKERQPDIVETIEID